MKVLVGSTNPVKRRAVERAFGRYFGAVQVTGLSVPSGVPDQPIDEETLRGARNRATALREAHDDPEVRYFVGIEGGVQRMGRRALAFGGMCVLDREGREGVGTSALFPLPPGVAEGVLAGRELGLLIDEITGEVDTKRRGGAIGHFTRGAIDRCDLYVGGLLVALIPFLNEDVYFAAPVGSVAGKDEVGALPGGAAGQRS